MNETIGAHKFQILGQIQAHDSILVTLPFFLGNLSSSMRHTGSSVLFSEVWNWLLKKATKIWRMENKHVRNRQGQQILGIINEALLFSRCGRVSAEQV